MGFAELDSRPERAALLHVLATSNEEVVDEMVSLASPCPGEENAECNASVPDSPADGWPEDADAEVPELDIEPETATAQGDGSLGAQALEDPHAFQRAILRNARALGIPSLSVETPEGCCAEGAVPRSAAGAISMAGHSAAAAAHAIQSFCFSGQHARSTSEEVDTAYLWTDKDDAVTLSDCWGSSCGDSDDDMCSDSEDDVAAVSSVANTAEVASSSWTSVLPNASCAQNDQEQGALARAALGHAVVTTAATWSTGAVEGKLLGRVLAVMLDVGMLRIEDTLSASWVSRGALRSSRLLTELAVLPFRGAPPAEEVLAKAFGTFAVCQRQLQAVTFNVASNRPELCTALPRMLPCFPAANQLRVLSMDLAPSCQELVRLLHVCPKLEQIAVRGFWHQPGTEGSSLVRSMRQVWRCSPLGALCGASATLLMPSLVSLDVPVELLSDPEVSLALPSGGFPVLTRLRVCVNGARNVQSTGPIPVRAAEPGRQSKPAWQSLLHEALNIASLEELHVLNRSGRGTLEGGLAGCRAPGVRRFLYVGGRQSYAECMNAVAVAFPGLERLHVRIANTDAASTAVGALVHLLGECPCLSRVGLLEFPGFSTGNTAELMSHPELEKQYRSRQSVGNMFEWRLGQVRLHLQGIVALQRRLEYACPPPVSDDLQPNDWRSFSQDLGRWRTPVSCPSSGITLFPEVDMTLT